MLGFFNDNWPKPVNESYHDWYDEFKDIVENEMGINPAPPEDGEDAENLYLEGYTPSEAAYIIDAEYTDSDDDEEPSYY